LPRLSDVNCQTYGPCLWSVVHSLTCVSTRPGTSSHMTQFYQYYMQHTCLTTVTMWW